MASLPTRDEIAEVMRKKCLQRNGAIPHSHLGNILKKVGDPEWTDARIDCLLKTLAADNGPGPIQYEKLLDWAFDGEQTSKIDKSLTVMTLNLQYYSSFPKDVEAGRKRLREITSATATDPPDVICVQEGLEGRDELGPATGYTRVLSSAATAQSIAEMVYNHEETLATVDVDARNKLLVNEIYVRGTGSSWEAVDSGTEQVSSETTLTGGADTGRVSGSLAIRSVVWVKLKRKDRVAGPYAFVMATHLTGGRFEDQFFVQQLAEERRMQPERAIAAFRRQAGPGDFGCLCGDFNATLNYTGEGPMHGYFTSSIQKALGVCADMNSASMLASELEPRFKNYMISPFKAIRRNGWSLAYDEAQVGYTSAFGHLIDHMATNCKVPLTTERFITTNQRFGKTKDTETPITDHNAVKVSFDLSGCFTTPPDSVGKFMASLSVMTLNMQYYSSYPKDVEVGRKRLREITAETSTPKPDIVCVQEGLDGRDELGPAAGYTRLVSSASIAQSITDMVYSDAGTLATVEEAARDHLLINEIYIRGDGKAWEAVDFGTEQVSSDLFLDGGEGTGRVSGHLAVRSVVWVKLRPLGGSVSGPFVFVLSTHLTGGRFEDQFFAQQLAGERKAQPQRAIGVFEWLSGPGDFGVLLGDFNATTVYKDDGPMHKYFESSIANAVGVQADMKTAGISASELEAVFKSYMISPFDSIKQCGWSMTYEEAEVGCTSAFGHLIDHMATNGKAPVKVERLITTNQRFSKEKDTDTPITDHNAVKTTFDLRKLELGDAARRGNKAKSNKVARFPCGAVVEFSPKQSKDRLYPTRVISHEAATGLYNLDCRAQVPQSDILWPTVQSVHLPGLPDEVRGSWDRYFEVVDGPGHEDTRGFPYSVGPFLAEAATTIQPSHLKFEWSAGNDLEVHRQQWRFTEAGLALPIVKDVFGSAAPSASVFHCTSPVYPVTLTGDARVAAGIPAEAKHYVWSYPMEGLAGTHTVNDPDMAFLMVGGYVYFAEQRGPPLRINAIFPSADGGLRFGPPRRMLPAWTEQLFQCGRFRQVTFKSLRDHGATHFCFIRPAENIQGSSICGKGGFAYLFRSGDGS